MSNPVMITPKQIQGLHSLAHKAGMDHEELHNLACGMTGASSLKELTNAEYISLQRELQKREGKCQRRKSAKKQEPAPGKMTTAQQGMAWRLMYELRSYDREPSAASLGERLSGVIKKKFGVDTSLTSPMKWLSFEQGNQLIEILKKYVYNAATKR